MFELIPGEEASKEGSRVSKGIKSLGEVPSRDFNLAAVSASASLGKAIEAPTSLQDRVLQLASLHTHLRLNGTCVEWPVARGTQVVYCWIDSHVCTN